MRLLPGVYPTIAFGRIMLYDQLRLFDISFKQSSL